MHDAARRVPPEQGALRPVQNLDAIDVDELTHEAAGIGDVNFVHIIPNGGRGRVRTDAADRQLAPAESAVLVADDQAGQRFRPWLTIPDPLVTDLFAPEDRKEG